VRIASGAMMQMKWRFLMAAFHLAVISDISAGQGRFFTIRDSVEMSTFVDPDMRVGDGRDAQVRFSPDGRRFAVVTTKGIIESNEIESTLWVFDADSVRNALFSYRQVAPPTAGARLAAVTNDSAVISNMRWSENSQTILFLRSTEHGRQLYRANLTDRTVQPLTPPDAFVSQYEVGSGTVVYTIARPNWELERAVHGYPINISARAVTGMPLDAILFPKRLLDDTAWKFGELWTIRNSRNVKVCNSDSCQPIRTINDNGLATVLTLSPDGRSVIIVRPMRGWQSEWVFYDSENPHAKFRANEVDTDFVQPWWRLPAEYALVDLRTGKTTSLVVAPLAILQGYGQPIKAVWSGDGKRVLLSATYLPLAGLPSNERSQRSRPCAAAVVEFAPSSVTCLRPMSRTTDAHALYARDLSFGASDLEAVVHLVNTENRDEPPELFRKEGEVWKQVIPTPEMIGKDSSTETIANNAVPISFSVVVHQELNEPPALFAINRRTGARIEIWNPNPQLSRMNMGEAAILRWKDVGGHDWVAGLLKPPDYVAGKKYPLVIQTHGFAEHRFLTDGGYTTALAARPLASAGFVVLQMPYNREHFVTPQELPDQIRGFQSAIDLLTSEGLIDPKRVGIIGFSRTCYHVEGALIADPERFAAATIADGVDQSYLQYLLSARMSGVSEQEAIYGTKPFGEGLNPWTRAAPGFNLYKIETPLRIEAVSGPASVLDEWEIYASLHLQGKPVDLILFPDGEHVLAKPLERLASQEGNVDWFRFWLKGEEDADPVKADQYIRWRRLRKLQEQKRGESESASVPIH
jgi:dipeptidyl aminopeptidase/acylaminoacyl peptidase